VPHSVFFLFFQNIVQGSPVNIPTWARHPRDKFDRWRRNKGFDPFRTIFVWRWCVPRRYRMSNLLRKLRIRKLMGRRLDKRRG